MSARSPRGFGRFSFGVAIAHALAFALAFALLVHAGGVRVASAQPGQLPPTRAPRGIVQGECPDMPRVTWTPARPRAGSLFDVEVRGRVDGIVLHVAGVLLHPDTTRIAVGAPTGASASATSGARVTRVLAAVPIDSVSGVMLRADCGLRVMNVRIPTDSGSYRMERLRVAPRFSAPPDSALVERQRIEAERAAAVSEQSHATPRLWTAPFAAPRSSRITSGFGTGRMFNGEVVSRHMGTDFAGAVGAPIRAANRGIVRLTGAFYLGGNVVYLDHGAGLVTAYLHLSRTLVAEGDTVAQGAIIGRVGATGRVTGPHLHFIARYGGITVDPSSLLGRR